MLAENKDLVRRAFEVLWNEVNLAGVDELFAADFVFHNPVRKRRGDREGIKHSTVNARKTFPDVQYSVTDQIAEGDRVVTFYLGTGTHSTEVLGVAATGKPIHINGIIVSRVADGKVTEEWYYDDIYSLMKEMGALPTSG